MSTPTPPAPTAAAVAPTAAATTAANDTGTTHAETTTITTTPAVPAVLVAASTTPTAADATTTPNETSEPTEISTPITTKTRTRAASAAAAAAQIETEAAAAAAPTTPTAAAAAAAKSPTPPSQKNNNSNNSQKKKEYTREERALVAAENHSQTKYTAKERALKTKLVREIVDTKEKYIKRYGKAPHGWLASKLREDKDGAYSKLNITCFTIRNEQHRRKRRRSKGLPLYKGEDNADENGDESSDDEIEEEDTPAKKRSTKKKGKKRSRSKAKAVTTDEEEEEEEDEDDDNNNRNTKRRRRSSSASKKKINNKKTTTTPKSNSKRQRRKTKTPTATDNEQEDSDSDESLPLWTPTRKIKLPQRVKTFSDGTLKPPEYVKAYEAFDRATIDRKPLLGDIDVKKQKVAEIEAQLKKAQDDLKASTDRLNEFDATVLEPAKEEVVTLELSYHNLPFTRRYHQLLAYKEEHGHFSLPGRMPDDKELDPLCIWINKMRVRRKKWLEGKIYVKYTYHFEVLDKIGFEWNVQDKWQNHFNVLMKFKDHHGHCMVPQHYHDQKLANWVVFQRQEMNSLKRDGTCTNLNKERIEKLNQVGFVWSVFDLKWNKIYDKLKTYQQRMGHCNVPKNYPEDPELATWVRKQREQYVLAMDPVQRRSRKCKLLPDKIEKLEALGFEWTNNTDDDDDNEAMAAIVAMTTAAAAAAVGTANNMLEDHHHHQQQHHNANNILEGREIITVRHHDVNGNVHNNVNVNHGGGGIDDGRLFPTHPNDLDGFQIHKL